MFGKISFIVPVYNAEPYLDTCIDSIIGQDYQNTEIIIINDGSSDNSFEIARRLASKDNRVQLLTQSNKGASAARNLGLEIATGDWIVFVDADDWIDSDFCQVLNAGCDADIVYFGFIEHKCNIITRKSINTNYIDQSESIDLVLTKLFLSKELFFGFTWNKFYRKSIIDKHRLRFNESLFIKEDEEFIIRYCRFIKKIYISAAVPYNYRVLQSSISHKGLKYRNLTGLASSIEEDLIDYPHTQFNRVVKNQVYKYYLYGTKELKNKPEQIESINAFIDFVEKNKHLLNNELEYRYLFNFKSHFLKSKLIKIVPSNPILTRATSSYLRLQLKKIIDLIKHAL